MVDYEERGQQLFFEVDKLKLMRDAQSVDSAFYLQFQEEIEQVTARWQNWRIVRPKVELLDKQIAVKSRELARVDDDDDDGGWGAVAVGAGVVGAVLLAVCLLFDPGWKLWAAMVVGFAVAIGAAVISVRSRGDASAECAVLRTDLEGLRRQRAELLGDS